MREAELGPVLDRDHLRAAGERERDNVDADLTAGAGDKDRAAAIAAVFRDRLENGFEQLPAHVRTIAKARRGSRRAGLGLLKGAGERLVGAVEQPVQADLDDIHGGLGGYGRYQGSTA
jgi:hypothetical protein